MARMLLGSARTLGKENLSHQGSSSVRRKRPPILVFSVIGGTIGIGVLLVLLVQSLEITVEPLASDAPRDSHGAVTPPVLTSTSDIPDPIMNEQLADGLELPNSGTPPSIDESINGNVAVPPTQSSLVFDGSLRVSNQTVHPIRVALLPQQHDVAMGDESKNDELLAADESFTEAEAYGEPVHWDFVPGEGAVRGLVLALPNRGLEVRQGDVITAFAQDGSRRYWGPYVVGNTSFPKWDADAKEWVLIFQDQEDL